MTAPTNDDERRAIWNAVDKLTKPRRQRLERTDAEWVHEHDQILSDIAAGKNGVCSVTLYRQQQAARTAGTAVWADVPSLWEQSTIALDGSETQTARGSKPLRERSIADLDLMEIRALIRDTTRRELELRNVHTAQLANGRSREFDTKELRHLASLVIKEGRSRLAGAGVDLPDLEFWRYRFEQWGRLLETYLNAAEREARPVRLRNSACPECGARQVVLDPDGERTVAPALVIDFRDGYVRAAECSQCGAAWFRGPDLEALADALGVGIRDARSEAACG